MKVDFPYDFGCPTNKLFLVYHINALSITFMPCLTHCTNKIEKSIKAIMVLQDQSNSKRN